MENKSFRNRFYSVLRWVGWVLLVQFVLINISAALYAYKLTHFYDNAGALTSSDNSNIFSKSWRLFTGPKYPKSKLTESPVFRYDTVVLQTKKGLKIEAWYGHTDSAPKGTVVLFHGIGGTKGYLLDEANEFLYKGYDVLMVDFRAHGNSDGHTTTIGVRESEEVKLAFDWLRSQQKKNIFLYGSSLGAVAVAKAVADYSLEPAGIFLEMPFQSLQGYLKRKARAIGFPGQPFAFLTTFWIGVERGFNGFRHQTNRYVRKIHCPVLLQWGTLDNYVLKNETAKIFEAIASTEKKLVMYEGAQHESLLRKDPLKWRIETENFLKMYTHKRLIVTFVPEFTYEYTSDISGFFIEMHPSVQFL